MSISDAEDEFLMVDARASGADSDSEAGIDQENAEQSTSAAAAESTEVDENAVDDVENAEDDGENDASTTDSGSVDLLEQLDATEVGRAQRALQALCHAAGAKLGSAAHSAVLREALSQRHAVEAVQGFLGSSAVCEAVVDVVRSDRPEEAVLRHTGNLLVALGDLVNAAPELAEAAPSLLARMLQGELKREAAPAAAAVAAAAVAAAVEEGEEEEDNKIVHVHVLCDGCASEERRAVSSAAGNRVGNYIAGVRWKSAIIEDFDLCSSCESSGDWESSHGPFLKITEPKKAPRQLVVVLRGDEPAAAQAQQPSSRPNWRARGIRPGCRGHSRRPVAPAPPAPPQPQQQQTPPVPAGQTSDQVRCPEGHALEGFCASIGFSCDVCRGAPGFGQPMFGCRRCNWDMCVACKDVQQSAAMSDLQDQGAKPPQQEQQEQQQPFAARPQARFVADVTLPDGSVVLPGQALTKTWRVENPSGAGQAWPQGVRLVCVGGERMGGPAEGIVLPQVEAQQPLDLHLPLTAPSVAGRYVGYWRLVTAENQRFGHRLWVDLTVAEPARFGPQLRTLADMGFAADEALLQLLEQEDGDLSRVIPRLCN